MCKTCGCHHARLDRGVFPVGGSKERWFGEDAIVRAVRGLPGVMSAHYTAKTVTVEFDPLKTALDDIQTVITAVRLGGNNRTSGLLD